MPEHGLMENASSAPHGMCKLARFTLEENKGALGEGHGIRATRHEGVWVGIDNLCRQALDWLVAIMGGPMGHTIP